jgi:hypothetical protein
MRTEGVVCVGVLCGSMLGWRNAGCSLRWVNVALICVLLLRCWRRWDDRVAQVEGRREDPVISDELDARGED